MAYQWGSADTLEGEIAMEKELDGVDLNISFNAVLSIGPDHIEIASLAISSLIKYTNVDKIFAITASKNFDDVKTLTDKIIFIDENSLIPGLDLGTLQNFLEKKTGEHSRAGWYFQQFLKMGISLHPNIGEHYLIWDSDTIMLGVVSFFSPIGKVLIKPSTEHHAAYFNTSDRLIGISKNADYSFISEHFMVTTSYMNELLSLLSPTYIDDCEWCWNIMNNIEQSDLSGSGFSEYELYGNFIYEKYPDSFEIRSLSSTRGGSGRFGMKPNRFDLKWLAKRYKYATFETYGTCGSKFHIFRRKLISLITVTAKFKYN